MPNDSNSQDSPNPPIEAKALSDESVGEELARLEALQLRKEELARSTTVANSTDIKNLKNAAIDLTEKQLASMPVIAKATAELDNLKRDQDAQDIIKIQIEQAIKDIQITQSEQEILHLQNQNDLAFLLREQRSKAEYYFAYRLIITTLCTTVLLSLAAGVWLTAVGVEIPQLLIVLSSSGLGAISGLLTPNPQAQKREIPVNRSKRK